VQRIASACIAVLAVISQRATIRSSQAASQDSSEKAFRSRRNNRSFSSARPGPDKTGITPAAGTITVNSTADVANGSDGLCTLREAITAANSDAASGVVVGECAAGSISGADEIVLTGVSGTISLASVLPNLSSHMALTGPGPNQLTIARSPAVGTPDFRIFTIDSGRSVTMTGLTISNGKATGLSNAAFGGGIFNSGSLTLQAYALEFVQTARFMAANAFPTTMTPTEFVDKLNQNAGNVLSPSERTAAINLFGGAGNTSNNTARAQALRQVAEDTDLYNAEYNRAFVMAEYFGYLRRNPNDAPESTLDYTGYGFWLTKLNQFNGNYINAEMVKAFLSSIEYRQRFGP
jgi:CSLREA domain-containing protein